MTNNDNDIASSMQRLFVNLAYRPHDQFADGSKKYECRAYSNRWNERNVVSGRRVELFRAYRRGYSLWGAVDDVHIGPLERIFEEIDFKQAIPHATNLDDAIASVKKFVGDHEKYIVFRVTLDPR